MDLPTPFLPVSGRHTHTRASTAVPLAAARSHTPPPPTHTDTDTDTHAHTVGLLNDSRTVTHLCTRSCTHGLTDSHARMHANTRTHARPALTAYRHEAASGHSEGDSLQVHGPSGAREGHVPELDGGVLGLRLAGYHPAVDANGRLLVEDLHHRVQLLHVTVLKVVDASVLPHQLNRG